MAKKSPEKKDGSSAPEPAASSAPPAPAIPNAPVTANPMNAQPVGPTGQPENPATPDVDAIVDDHAVRTRRGWRTVADLIEHVERHARATHGLEPDRQLFVDIAEFLRDELNLPVEEPTAQA